MRLWPKLALRELVNHRGFSLFFLANLTLGLVAFIALDSLKLSLHDHIENKSKSILAADLRVQASRPITKEEIQTINQALPLHTHSTRMINFMTMVRSGANSRLVDIVALDPGYPLYGKMVLGTGEKLGPQEVNQRLLQAGAAWGQPELLQTLQLKQGDELSIGQAKFNLSEILVEAPGQNYWKVGIAYKVFISIKKAEASGLLAKGSRRFYTRLYKIPAGFEAESVAAEIKKRLEHTFGPNSYLSIKTQAQANEQMSWLLGYLNDYLGLVALVALFLAGLGTAFLFRAFLNQRIKELAILRVLGAKPSGTLWLSVYQIIFLGVVAALLASGLAQVALPLFAEMLKAFLPLGFVAKISTQSMLLALVVGVLGSLFFCLPLLLRLPQLNPRVLLSDRGQEAVSLNQGGKMASFLSYIPLTVLYWVLAVWLSRSWVTGTVFLAALVGSTLLLSLIALMLLRLAGHSSGGPLAFKLGLRNLGRAKGATLTSFVAIGVGSLLINLIPQIHQGLVTEISPPKGNPLPSFFLFDIQPEQLKPIESYVLSLGYQTKNPAAMILARLTGLKSKAVTQTETREEDSKKWFRRRDQNLSYRWKLYDTEKLTAGVWFSKAYDPTSTKLPEFSLEQRYASQLEVGLGDTLTFDVQGVELKGRVTSLRRVKWNSFQPNFYILVQPGVLEEAPCTWLATIDQVPPEKTVWLQTKINQKFTNISLLNVTRLVNKILGIAGQIRWAVQVMALFVVLAGLVVLYSIARFNAQSRSQEINLLKVLGASFGRLRLMIALEFGLVGFLGASAGALISLVVAWGFTDLLFERFFEPNLWSLGQTVGLITILSLVTALVGTNKVLKQNPAHLLQAL